jgi:hypothetical protein
LLFAWFLFFAKLIVSPVDGGKRPGDCTR